MERNMITAILIAAGAGLLVGGGTTYALTRDRSPATVEAVASVVGEVAEVADVTGDAANAERLAELAVHRALAEAPAATVVCRAAVEPKAEQRIVALCAMLACWSNVNGPETSAGLGCIDRGKTLDGLLAP